MSFNFNKLDDYKVVLDDGLIIGQSPEDGIKSESKKWFVIWKEKGFYFLEDGNSNKIYNIKEYDWETFKKKIADYFLGADKNEN